mmetsp:Transcript_9170/g.15941  ORF Transcript_9170/g.15941 Transcript_9170/m.15941 type:complete len:147 (-) Transcript_9170:162-602(-)
MLVNMKHSNNSFRSNKGSSANQEWPEMINTASIGTRLLQRTKIGPTPSETTTIDLVDISADDLKSIQSKDPFLYYSIPGVRSSKVLMRDIDISNLGRSQFRNCRSCPSRLETVQYNSQPHRVTRSSCISFECHPDLLFEDDLLDDA